MNTLLLSLGTAIALALIAAFAAPFFIDWSAQRGYFEERVSAVLGRPVQFAGALDVRLVPFPSLTAEDVRIGDGAEAGGEGADRLVVRAALAPLLSGELQVSELVVTRPRATFKVDEDGRMGWSAAADAWLPLPLDRTRIERFEIVDGTFSLEDAHGDRRVLSRLNLAGSATTLAGPFRIEGSGVAEDSRLHLRLATGALQSDGTVRLTGSLTPIGDPGIDFDGRLRLAGASTTYEGAVVIAGIDADRPWRIEGAVAASAREAVFERIVLQVGPEERRMTLNGSARVDLASAPRFDAALEARRLDLDRSFGGTPDSPLTLAEVADRFVDIWGGGHLPLPGRLTVEVGSVVAAGNLMEDLFLDVEIDGAGWRVRHAEVEAPGASAARFAGSLWFDGERPRIDGTLNLDSERAGMLSGWLFGEDARLSGLHSLTGPLAMRADMAVEDGALTLDDIEVEAAEARLLGALSYRPPADGTRGGLVARATVERLEFDSMSLPILGRRAGDLGALIAGTDIELALEVAILRAGALELADIDVALALTNGDLRIDSLRVHGRDSTEIVAHGAVNDLFGMPDGRLAVELETGSPADLADGLAALDLPAGASLLRSRAEVLAPLQMAIEIEAEHTSEDSIQARMTLDGSAGVSRVEAAMVFAGKPSAVREGDIEVNLDMTARDGTALARQLGLYRATGDGPAYIMAGASGRLGDLMTFDLATAGLGLDGEMAGGLQFGTDWRPAVEAQLALEVTDPAELLDGLGIALLHGGRLPMTFDARLSVESRVWRFSDVVVASEELQGQGDLAIRFDGPAPSLSGVLEVDRVSLPWLLATMLGPDAFAVEGENAAVTWPESVFTPSDWGNVRGRLHLTAPTLELGGDVRISSASLGVSFDSRGMRLDDIAGDVFGGRLSAGADIAVDGRVARFNGRFELADARLEEIVWRSGDRPVATGLLKTGIEVAGQGRSLRGLVSSLAGEGTVQVEQGVLRRFNPAAFDQIVRAVDAGLELEEDRVREAFAAHLDAGVLRFERAEGTVSIASGVMRVSNAHFDTTQADSFASAAIDLAGLELESDWTFQVEGDEADGRTREVGLLFAGPLAAPSRQIDVAPLVGYLTVRAFEQEVQRLEELQEEILRRHQFNQDIEHFSRTGRRHEQAVEARSAAAVEAEARREAEAAEERARQEGAVEIDLRRLIEEALRDTPTDGPVVPETAPVAPAGERGPLVITPPAAME